MHVITFLMRYSQLTRLSPFVCAGNVALYSHRNHIDLMKRKEISKEQDGWGKEKSGSSPANETALTRNKCRLLCSLLRVALFLCDRKALCMYVAAACMSFILALHRGWLANSRLQPEVDKNQYIIPWGLTHTRIHTHTHTNHCFHMERWSKTNTQPTLVQVWFL